MKYGAPSVLDKKLSKTQFFLSQLLILIAGLCFLFGLHFFVNIQYQNQKPKEYLRSGPVTNLPKSLILSLDGPDDNLLTFKKSIIISGKTLPSLDVLISSELSDDVLKSKQDGIFSITIDLTEGVNNINIVVFDKEGNSKSETRTVYYSKEKI